MKNTAGPAVDDDREAEGDLNATCATDPDPAAAHHEVHTRLHRLRIDSGRTQTEAARAHDWSVSKVGRIEKGHVRVSRPDLLALLDFYGATDPAARERLLRLARVARQRQLFTDFRDLVCPESLRLLRYAVSATHVREVALSVVPNLLQTPAYTRALIAGVMRTDAAATGRFVALVAERQRRTHRVWQRQAFLVDEGVLGRAVGGPAVMAEQLDHLRTMAERPEISIRVLPFGWGAHPRLVGSHTHLQMALNTDLVYTDTTYAPPVVDKDPEITERYREQFDALQKPAPSLNNMPGLVDRAHHWTPSKTADRPTAAC